VEEHGDHPENGLPARTAGAAAQMTPAVHDRSDGSPGYRLPAVDKACLVELIESLLPISTEGAFIAWTAGPLQALLPHGAMICGMAEVSPRGVRIKRVVMRNWPFAFLERLTSPAEGFHSPIMQRWLKTQRAQLYDPEEDHSITHERWLQAFHDFDLRNIAAHGILDFGSSLASYFNFVRIPEKLAPRHAHVLELLAPHMHLALGRALSSEQLLPQPQPAAALQMTERERVVLNWMQQGKTNWEIAQICMRSEHTVKNQVSGILAKLGAANRAQAVAKALALRPPGPTAARGDRRPRTTAGRRYN
jgi:transcriptional regulator EpsA